MRIGYLRETPLMVMTKNSVAHDTVPYFMERFRDAYTTQLQNFAQNVLQERTPPITIDDGLEALRLGVAATRAQESGAPVVVADVGADDQRTCVLSAARQAAAGSGPSACAIASRRFNALP